MIHRAPTTRRAFGVIIRNEQGATLVLVAVVMVALLGMVALAVDVGMGYTAKIEAQRTADSGALAGASAFLDFQPAAAVAPAEARAYEYALRNDVRGIPVDSSEVTVQVLVDSAKVRVWVQRQSIGTWFARLIGFDQFDVLAEAAAQATEAGAARCLKPFAVPDMWHDADDDTNHDDVWDEGEEWVLGSNPSDRYMPFTGPGGSADETGYGSGLRTDYDHDHGRQINLKMPDPQSEYVMSPGVFLPWRIPLDEDQEECAMGGGGGQDAGGAVYRQNICTCNNSLVELGTEYEIEPGNMIGPTAQGMDELIGEDPGAYWDPSNGGSIQGSAFGDGMASPRVIKIALFDPSLIQGSGMQTIHFNNFALMFIEDQASPRDPVVGRFLYYVSGEDSEGPTNGSLVRYLRLVE